MELEAATILSCHSHQNCTVHTPILVCDIDEIHDECLWTSPRHEISSFARIAAARSGGTSSPRMAAITPCLEHSLQLVSLELKALAAHANVSILYTRLRQTIRITTELIHRSCANRQKMNHSRCLPSSQGHASHFAYVFSAGYVHSDIRCCHTQENASNQWRAPARHIAPTGMC